MLSIGRKIGFLRYLWGRFKDHVQNERILYSLAKKYPGFKYETNVQVKSPDRLRMGKNVLIQRNAVIHCGGGEWCDFKGKVVLGDHVVVSNNCVLYAPGEIYIDDYSQLGPGTKVMTQSGDRSKDRMTAKTNLKFGPIVIGKGCWIGSNVVILHGTKIGDFCTVAPNSVLRGEFPKESVVIGTQLNKSYKFKDEDFFDKP